MFDDTINLAENKLLLLYVLKKLKVSVSRTLISDIILQNEIINYFVLQQYLTELINSKFIIETEDNDSHKLSITEKGLKVLEFFEGRISDEKKHVIDEYLSKNSKDIKNELSITSDYTIDGSNSYVVHLKADENGISLIDLKVTVGNNKQARDLCKRWKDNSSPIYTDLMNILLKDD